MRTAAVEANGAASRAGDAVVVLANRAPFRHERDAGRGVVARRSASGLVTALEPLVAACGGTWVAHGDGSADRGQVDGRDGLPVPPGAPRYRLRYVWLSDAEVRGFYYGFANEGLWPLCHEVHVAPVFRAADFRMYRLANARFAAAVADEAGGAAAPLVFVQDYHFALAPRMIRSWLPSSTVVAYWHIPWPPPRVLQMCPWAAALLDGLLAADVVGLQTGEDCGHFLDAVAASPLGAVVDRDEGLVFYGGRAVRVRAYPVGVEWNNATVRALPAPGACRARVWRDLGLPDDVRLGVGVDRLDYTKGIDEKFLAVERLLESAPSWRGRFVFVQVAEPSRDCLPAYQEARAGLAATAARVNARFGAGGWQPIVLLERHHDADEVYRLYRAADLCYVNSLRDGMNLVAKEFVSARADERGVLVLSRFAGAAQQLASALLVDPHDTAGSAAALGAALGLPPAEQARRMRALRESVARCDARWWAGQLLGAAREARRTPPPAIPLPAPAYGAQPALGI